MPIKDGNFSRSVFYDWELVVILHSRINLVCQNQLQLNQSNVILINSLLTVVETYTLFYALK